MHRQLTVGTYSKLIYDMTAVQSYRSYRQLKRDLLWYAYTYMWFPIFYTAATLPLQCGKTCLFATTLMR